MALLVLLLAVQTLAVLGFFFGVAITPFHGLLALVAAGGWLWRLSGVGRPLSTARRVRRVGVESAFLVVLLAAATLLAGRFYDVSADGQTYHQRAVIDLVQGWNPVYTPWVQEHFSIVHFPKGPWMDYAALYALIGRIEPAKGINLALIVAAFLACFHTLRRLTPIPVVASLVLSALAAANPVAISQSLTFYVDGQLASLLLVSACLGALLVREPDPAVRLALGVAVALMVNVKLTALVYAFFLGLAILAGSFFWARRSMVRNGLVVAVAAVLAVFVLGFNPYVTNTVRFLNPFYPMVGPGATVEYRSYRPSNFDDMGRARQFAVSLFAPTEWGTTPAQPKWPLTSTAEEWRSVVYPDPKTGGFGPLFSGALVGSAAVLIASAIGSRSRRLFVGACLSGAVVASAIVIPEGWLARYVPQVWWVPLILVVAALASRGVSRYLAYAVVAILALNAGAIAARCVVFQAQQSAELALQLQTLQQAGEPVLLDFFNYTSNAVRLQEASIQYREVPSDDIGRLNCRRRFELQGSQTNVCVPIG